MQYSTHEYKSLEISNFQAKIQDLQSFLDQSTTTATTITTTINCFVVFNKKKIHKITTSKEYNYKSLTLILLLRGFRDFLQDYFRLTP